MHRLGPLIALSMLLTACGAEQEVASSEPAAEPSSLPAVKTLILEPRRHDSVIATFGVVEGLEDVDIAAEMSGTVARVFVQEGDSVAVGDLLLELDSEKQEYRVAQASQEAQQARALLDEAQLRLQRRKDLADKDTISVEDFDSARLTMLATSASYQRALAAKQLAERELADTRVLSPSAGLVDKRFIEPGEPVAVGTTLLSLQVVHTLRVHTWVSEADILRVRANSAATVSLTGAPLQPLDAVVEWVGVTADPRTGNFPVKLLLQDESDWIRPGMTATAAIEGMGIEDALILPESALIDRARRQIVFVASEENGRVIARIREPQLAAGFSNRLVVLAGLQANDRLIVSGQAGLQDGTEVSVLP